MKKIESEDIKKIVVKIGKSIGKILLTISLPIIIIVIILSVVVWFIFIDEGTWEEDELGRPSTYTKNVNMDPESGLTINKEGLIKQALLDKGYSEEEINKFNNDDIIRIFNMNKKLNTIITDLNNCTEAEILWCISEEYSKYMKKPEELEYLLRAEVITQYPKIDGLSSDKINGIIQFERVSTDEASGKENRKTLKFIKQDKFEEKFQNYQNSGDKDVLNYFTLDDEQNVVIATWSEETGYFQSNNTVRDDIKKINAGIDETRIKSEYDSRYELRRNEPDIIAAEYITYNIQKTKINYKNMVSEYTLPFEYLWALLVMGESYDFVHNLAQLAYDSEIKIAIYDTITTTITEDKKQYSENFREKYNKYEDSVLIDYKDWEEVKYDYYENETVKNIYNSIQYDISVANTWLVKEEISYGNRLSQASPIQNTNNIPDEDWSNNGSYVKQYNEQRFRQVPQLTPDGQIFTNPVTGEPVFIDQPYTVEIKEEIFKEKKLTGQNNSTTTNVTYNKYEKTSSKVTEKTDLDPSTDENFVKLLRNDKTAYYGITNKGTVSWLVDILENNESTANMTEITLYLLNKATQSDDYFDESKKSFDDLWNEIVISNTTIEMVGQDFIVDTTLSDSKLVITDREILANAIEKIYTGDAKRNLLGQVDTFLEMQEKYKVNALFAIAVTQAESSCGTNFSGAIPDWTYNWMSLTGSYNGQSYRNPNSSNKRIWRVYPNFREATLDFGDLISNSAYYFKNGKNTVMSISPIFCGGTAWGEKVISFMTKLYNAAGISTAGMGGEESSSSGDSYSSVFTVGDKTYKNYKQPPDSDWCGITSTAIVLSGYGFDNITPQVVFDNSPGYTWRAYLGRMLNIPTPQHVITDIRNGVINQLREGKPVIVHVPANSGKYSTSAEHFFVLLSISEDGQQFYVSDPGGNYVSSGRNGWNSINVVLEYVDSYIKF